HRRTQAFRALPGRKDGNIEPPAALEAQSHRGQTKAEKSKENRAKNPRRTRSNTKRLPLFSPFCISLRLFLCGSVPLAQRVVLYYSSGGGAGFRWGSGETGAE